MFGLPCLVFGLYLLLTSSPGPPVGTACLVAAASVPLIWMKRGLPRRSGKKTAGEGLRKRPKQGMTMTAGEGKGSVEDLCQLMYGAKTASPKQERPRAKKSEAGIDGVKNVSRKTALANSNWAVFQQSLGKAPPSKASDPQVLRDPSKPKKKKGFRPMMDAVAIDCEMVGVGDDGKDNMLARVSLVNSKGDCIYDKFVKPQEQVTDYRTYVSGVRAQDMADGEEFEKVQKEVAGLLKDKLLVGHSLKGDLEVLFLSHPRWALRDTSKYFRQKGKRTPSLKKLAAEYLGVAIQEGEHSSVQDAQAAIQLYNMYRKPWEQGGGSSKSNHVPLRKPRL